MAADAATPSTCGGPLICQLKGILDDFNPLLLPLQADGHDVET
jgi:hypothetical protein